MAVVNGILLLVLGALWGASFLFIRVAAPVLGPVPLMAVRVSVAGVALLAYVAASRGAIPWRRSWNRYVILGILSAAIPFTLIAFAQLRLTASLAAILNATTPLFAMLFASIRLGEAVSARKALGMTSGIAGVAAVVGWSPLDLDIVAVASILASLAAAAFYAIGGVYAKQRFEGEPPVVVATGQQLGAAVVLLPFAAATLPDTAPPIDVAYATLTLAFACTAAAFVIFYRLIAAVGPTATLTVTFLVPLFAVLWGAVFLGEAVTSGTVAGLVLILGGVSLVTGTPRLTTKTHAHTTSARRRPPATSSIANNASSHENVGTHLQVPAIEEKTQRAHR